MTETTEPGKQNAPPPVARRLLWVFMNDRGLRAGWRTLLFLFFVAVFVAIQWLILAPALRGHRYHEITPLLALAQSAPEVIAVLGAAVLMARIERRPLLAVPFTGPAAPLRFATGALWGLLALSALVLSLWHSHLLIFSSSMALHGAPVIGYGLLWAALFFLVALFEESLFRGYLQVIISEGMGFWPAALLLSVLFGAVHVSNHGESNIGVFAAGVVGLLFAVSVWYTGSLWWAIGFHAAWDWAQSFLYGTADSGLMVRGHLLTERPVGEPLLSGGATGPEGSLYALPLLLILLLGAWLWWRRSAPAFPAKPERGASV